MDSLTPSLPSIEPGGTEPYFDPLPSIEAIGGTEPY